MALNSPVQPTVKVFGEESAWLEARRRFVGASEVGAILGVNPYRTALQVYLEKIGEAAPLEETEPMLWGRRLEGEIIAEFFTRNPAFSFNPCPKGTVLFHPEYPYMAATPDYWDGSLGMEVKNTKIQIEKEEDIPRYWIAQTQYQMYVAGTSAWFLAVLCQGQRLVTFRLDADENWQTAILGQVKAFWEMVQKRIPPVAQEGDGETVARMFPPFEGAVESTDEIERWAEEFLDAHQREVQAKKDKEAAKARLIQAASGASSIIGKGWKATYKVMERSAYEVKAGSYSKFELRRMK